MKWTNLCESKAAEVEVRRQPFCYIMHKFSTLPCSSPQSAWEARVSVEEKGREIKNPEGR